MHRIFGLCRNNDLYFIAKRPAKKIAGRFAVCKYLFCYARLYLVPQGVGVAERLECFGSVFEAGCVVLRMV